jgi:zinc transport system substrate-binding protein
MGQARLLALVAIVLAAGCQGTPAATATRRLPVAATPFALAEVARRVGLGRVIVSDHGEVVLTADGDPWLDPVAMQEVAAKVAATLARHDPTAQSAYQAAARAYQAQLGALDIDYRSSLADCARHDIVTADAAFVPLGRRYNFADHTAHDAGVVALVSGKGLPVVFTEPGVATGPVLALAQETGTRVDQLDTTIVETSDEAARGATYLSLMTDNLVKLRKALACTAAA